MSEAARGARREWERRAEGLEAERKSLDAAVAAGAWERAARIAQLSTLAQRRAWESVGAMPRRPDGIFPNHRRETATSRRATLKVARTYVGLAEAVDAACGAMPEALCHRRARVAQLRREKADLEAEAARLEASEADLDRALAAEKAANARRQRHLVDISSRQARHLLTPWTATVLARFVRLRVRVVVSARAERRRAAAAVIQCGARVASSRLRFQAARTARDLHLHRRTASASRIQALARGSLYRTRARSVAARALAVDRAVRKIQGVWRASPCWAFRTTLRLTSAATALTLEHIARNIDLRALELTLETALANLPPTNRSASFLKRHADTHDDLLLVVGSGDAAAASLARALEGVRALVAHPLAHLLLSAPPHYAPRLPS